MWDFLTLYTFGNPDFGRSDIWHLSLPLRHFFADALKRGVVPVWSKDIGTGFPIFAEGEVGMLNPINLFLYRFFPTILAFNLTYLAALLISFTGCFLFARSIKISRLVAIFFAIIFTFSGIFITQVRAVQFVQALSFLPWIFLATEKFLELGKKKWLALLSLSLGLQLLAGYPQISMITLIGIAIYFAAKLFPYRPLRQTVNQSVLMGCSIMVALIIASPQLLATWQLTQLSLKSGGLDVAKLALYPYNPKNFLTFLNPYLWGDPRIGTYPQFSSSWGIFWESTGYFGIAPFLLSLASLFVLVKTRFKNIFWTITIISAILLLGKFTPFFFVFQIPPLSFFRVPARFLILLVWALTILASLTLEVIRKRFPRLAIVIIFVGLLDVAGFVFNFSPRIDTNRWLKPPETVSILKEDTSWFRVYSVVPGNEWNDIFQKTGWQDINEYVNFRNALDPNQNIFWDIPSTDIYNGLYPRRLEYYKGLIENGLTISGQDLNISSSSAKLLSLAGTKYIISPRRITKDDWSLIASTSGRPTFYIYKNPHALPHTYLTRNYTVASSLADLMSKTIDATNSAVVLEKEINLSSGAPATGTAQVTGNDDSKVTVQIDNPGGDSLLVLSDSFYPIWEAFVDEKETEILPANINQRVVVIPPGNHTVIYKIAPLGPFASWL